MKKTKNMLFRISFLYLTLYIPVMLMTYCPQWYQFNCRLHPVVTRYIGYQTALRYIDELTSFFLHQAPLPYGWTEKEKKHLAEVRNILDGCVWATIVFIILFVSTFNRDKLPLYALTNLVIIAALLFLIMPFFKTFWVEIFHPLLFGNNFWLNDQYDRSFYIMPPAFFKNSAYFFISASAILNGVIWFLSRKRQSATSSV